MGQLVQNKQTKNGRTDTTNRITFLANAAGNPQRGTSYCTVAIVRRCGQVRFHLVVPVLAPAARRPCFFCRFFIRQASPPRRRFAFPGRVVARQSACAARCAR